MTGKLCVDLILRVCHFLVTLSYIVIFPFCDLLCHPMLYCSGQIDVPEGTTVESVTESLKEEFASKRADYVKVCFMNC